MPHFICRWPGGDVLLASVESRQELDAILQERCEPGVCKVARYHGPLVLELKPDVPGVARTSVERFQQPPPCPGFAPAWPARCESGDADLLAADGSSQRVHKLVLQCRLPALQGQAVAPDIGQVRLACVPDGACLLAVVEFLYLDDVARRADLTPQLHQAALACGLQRLAQLCEARFAQQLELQLQSMQGLCEEGRGGVLDSFVGWARYAEQLGRQELWELCAHALARHVTEAQARPSWPLLSAATGSLVQLVAASTAPPLIHRQLLLDGSAILPVRSNPAPAAAGSAGTTAVAPVVSVDADAFAAAGGRMTSSEWQQLHNFRSAVASSLQARQASPIAIDEQHLAACSLAAAGGPHVAFAVKEAVLGPHKRLMDSVCRFAFPATHSLLGSGWRLCPASTADGAGAPAAAAAAPGVAAGAASAGADGKDAPAVPVPVPPEPLLPMLPVVAEPAEHVAPACPAQGEAVAGLAAALAAEEGADRTSTSSSQHAMPGHTDALLQEQLSVRTSTTGCGASAPGQAGTCSTRQLRSSRMMAAAAGGQGVAAHRAAALAGRGSRSEPRPSWGSGVSQMAEQQQLQLQQQQQQPGNLVAGGADGCLPAAVASLQHVVRLLEEDEQAAGAWGSGTLSRQPSGQQQQQQPVGRQTVGHQGSELSSQIGGNSMSSRLGRRQQQQQQQQPGTGNELEAAARAAHVQQQHFSGTAAGSAAEWPATGQGSGWPPQHSGQLLELPAFWRPAIDSSYAAAGASEHAPASSAAAAAGSPPMAALQRALVDDFVLYEEASAARQHVVGILVAVENGDVAAGQRLLAPSCAELIAATAPVAAPSRVAGGAGTGPGAQTAAAAATAPGTSVAASGRGDEGTAAAVRAAAEALRGACGISKLLGMAASSRAALEPSPAQQQRRQQQLIRALQRIPGLSRLLVAQAGGAPSGGAPGAPPSPPEHGGGGGSSGNGEEDLAAAVADLVQLPELLHGLQLFPAMLTQEQFQQHQAQLQQLGASAAALLASSCPPGTGSPPSGGQATPAAAAAAATESRELQAGMLLSSILACLGTAAAAAVGPGGGGGGGGGASEARGAAGAAGLGARPPALGAGSHVGSLLSAAAGGGPPGGVSARGVLNGVPVPGALAAVPGGGPLGLFASTSAAAAASGTGGAPGAPMPGGSRFAPTGVGALLAGGLLAEGGVAGDSMLEDMAADVLLGASSRRITCHGLYELCAALARPADAHGSPPQQQQQAQLTRVSQRVVGCCPAGGAEDGGCSQLLLGHKRRLSSEEHEQPAAKR